MMMLNVWWSLERVSHLCPSHSVESRTFFPKPYIASHPEHGTLADDELSTIVVLVRSFAVLDWHFMT